MGHKTRLPGPKWLQPFRSGTCLVHEVLMHGRHLINIDVMLKEQKWLTIFHSIQCRDALSLQNMCNCYGRIILYIGIELLKSIDSNVLLSE